ncbi:unnamed protein product [Closterium sp. NIES-65]|nr:unnamed protein product [Closterium sp. NIES-65]
MAHEAHHKLFCGTVTIQGLKADEAAHDAHHKLFCGTVTIQGRKADEAAHDAHHRLFCGTVTVQGWRNERVVHTVSESTRDTRNACSTGAGAAETAAGRIVLITHADCTAVQLAKCGADCGSVGEGNGCESHGAAAGTFLTSFALPLCALSPSHTMQMHKIAAVLERPMGMQEIAAVLERGMGVSPTWLLGGQWKVRVLERAMGVNPTWLLGGQWKVSISGCVEGGEGCCLAVLVLNETAPGFRRRGVATEMMKAVSVSFAYACQLSSTQIAFSQPTESGRAFAAALCHPKPFLVYK